MDIAAIDEFEPFMDHEKKRYLGQIDFWKKSKRPTYINPIVKKGSEAFQNAKSRCGGALYPTYSKLRVDFDKREFLYWWIIQMRFSNLEKPTLGRIDHSKGYSFDNIMLQEHSENSKERFSRIAPFKKGTPLKIYRHKKLVAFAKSMHQAAVCTDVDLQKISKIMSGKNKQSNGWSFEYDN